jgi:decaprenyl-phosphate phosphoribosyltransferase
MKEYIQLIRPKDWAKNLFLFVPVFFAEKIFDSDIMLHVFSGFVCFSLIASAVYIINDYRDIEEDKKHPLKCNRPLASGRISKNKALILLIFLLAAGFIGAWFNRDKFLFVLSIYFFLNVAYSFGLKNIPILDIIIIAIGFVLRVKTGAVIARIGLSEWLTIMVFLLALFMAVAKRRDDVLIKLASGNDMRKAVKGYNLDFINTILALICAVIIVSYLMYTLSPEIIIRLKTYRLYYTCLFVVAGVFRYLQLIFVDQNSQSPTKIFYTDRFIQLSILFWIISFYIILYMKDMHIFK